MNKILRRLPVAAAAAAFAVALTPHVAAAATTLQLFNARDVALNVPGGTSFGLPSPQRSVLLFCLPNSLTIIDSPGSKTGVIVDNLLTVTVRRIGRPAGPVQNLCTEGNGASPAAGSGNSCFSSADPVKAFQAGTPANQAYEGVGTVTVPTVTGIATYTFQLVNAPGAAPNPAANNALRLRTSCQVRGG